MQRIVLILDMAQHLNITLFGITRDIVGHNSLKVSVEQPSSVESLLEKLKAEYPRLNDIRSILVAVNSEYAEGSQFLNETDEIALIPPVSGG